MRAAAAGLPRCTVIFLGMIAEVGETGVATGPHLHFELHEGSQYLNPIYYVSLA